MDEKYLPTTIDEYIAAYPPDVQAILQRVRETIAAAAPDAVERIAYRMASFELLGALVYFGGFKKHLGFFPPVRDERLRAAAAAYMNPKGNLQFRYDAPIPYALITRIVKARVKENAARKRSR
jgi:uncharacterized protein YdhG (YjbR/CyaY superfamily)